MSDLNERQVAALRALSRGEVIAPGPTMAALKRRGLVVPIDRTGRDTRTVRLTKEGRAVLAELDAEGADAKGAKVQLSPGVTTWGGQAIPDADLRQLLALLDHGTAITRTLYHQWRIEQTATLAGAIDPTKLDRTIRAALADGLVEEVTTGRSGTTRLSLSAAPIHLARDDSETWCGRRITRAGRDRIRYAMGSAQGPVHQRCVERSADPGKRAAPAPAPYKVDEVVRFRHNGAATGRLFRVVEVDGLDGDMVRVVWDNPPEDFTDEINARWVGVGMVERPPA